MATGRSVYVYDAGARLERAREGPKHHYPPWLCCLDVSYILLMIALCLLTCAVFVIVLSIL